jgi:hypothetical protein
VENFSAEFSSRKHPWPFHTGVWNTEPLTYSVILKISERKRVQT